MRKPFTNRTRGLPGHPSWREVVEHCHHQTDHPPMPWEKGPHAGQDTWTAQHGFKPTEQQAFKDAMQQEMDTYGTRYHRTGTRGH